MKPSVYSKVALSVGKFVICAFTLLLWCCYITLAYYASMMVGYAAARDFSRFFGTIAFIINGFIYFGSLMLLIHVVRTRTSMTEVRKD